jgi:hypothetical protein
VPTLFITGIERLRIEEDLGRGERVADLFYLTNNRERIVGLLSERLVGQIGVLEAEYLTSGMPVAYSVDDQTFENNDTADQWLHQRLGYVAHFLNFLWLVRDNAAYLELGFLEDRARRGGGITHRRLFGSAYSDANARFDMVTVTREELRLSRDLYRRHMPADVVMNPQPITEAVGRWTRAHYFVQASRSTSDLGIKIANYCTAFEALASTDIQELAHKLAERIACFLEPAGEARLRLFRDVKAAYALRSKVVHGGRGDQNLRERVQQAATNCDGIARRLLRKILDDETLHDRFMLGRAENSMEDYFLSLVLS